MLSEPDFARGQHNHRWPHVLPGGDAVLLTVGHAEMETWDEARIAVLRPATGELRVIVEGGSQAAYSPTGHLLYLHGGALLAVAFDRAALAVTGTPVTVVEDVDTAAGFGLSADGTLLYVVTDKGILWCLDLQTGKTVYGPERLAVGTYSSSPLLADGKLYITNEDALTSVVQSGPEFELLAENSLEGFTVASPVAAGGKILLRTGTALYCIGTSGD